MILVSGAKGMVGSYVEEVFDGEPLSLTDSSSMDVTDFESVRKTFEKVKPKVVLHLAAATDVDRCEAEVDWAYKTNVIGTQNIAVACENFNTLLIYVSTGGLFDGSKMDPYTEFDLPSPVNVYAKTKYEGEKIVRNFLNRYFIIRAGWMIGGKEKDKKFVSKMVALCQSQDTIHVVSDKLGTLTYARDLLETIKKLISTPFYGLYHVANQGVCSRYDIALEIAKILKSSVKIVAVGSDFFPLLAPRPRSEAIRNYMLSLRGFDNMPSWRDALQTYLHTWLRV